MIEPSGSLSAQPVQVMVKYVDSADPFFKSTEHKPLPGSMFLINDMDELSITVSDWKYPVIVKFTSQFWIVGFSVKTVGGTENVLDVTPLKPQAKS